MAYLICCKYPAHPPADGSSISKGSTDTVLVLTWRVSRCSSSLDPRIDVLLWSQDCCTFRHNHCTCHLQHCHRHFGIVAATYDSLISHRNICHWSTKTDTFPGHAWKILFKKVYRIIPIVRKSSFQNPWHYNFVQFLYIACLTVTTTHLSCR
jgi:hypothetical protein